MPPTNNSMQPDHCSAGRSWLAGRVDSLTHCTTRQLGNRPAQPAACRAPDGWRGDGDGDGGEGDDVGVGGVGGGAGGGVAAPRRRRRRRWRRAGGEGAQQEADTPQQQGRTPVPRGPTRGIEPRTPTAGCCRGGPPSHTGSRRLSLLPAPVRVTCARISSYRAAVCACTRRFKGVAPRGARSPSCPLFFRF